MLIASLGVGPPTHFFNTSLKRVPPEIAPKSKNMNLRGPGGLYDFLVVYDRGDCYLSDPFNPMEEYCS